MTVKKKQMNRAEYMRAFSKARKEQGLCHDCSHPVVPGHTFCAECLEKRRRSSRIAYACDSDNKRAKMKELRDYRKKNHICVACGKCPARKGMTMCQTCADKESMRRKARRERRTT